MIESPEALQSLMAIHTVYREYDGAQKLLEEQIGVPICISCGECCRHNTPIAYGVEAANAVSRFLGKGIEWATVMQRRIEGWLLEYHRQCPTYEPLADNKYTFGLDNKIRDEMLALSKAQCPFFEDNRCLIYDARPLACRAYGVTVSSNCKRPRGRYESESRTIVIGGAAAQQLRRDVDAVLEMVPRPTWALAGFFPTLIFSHIWPDKFKAMVSNGLVATAKLVMTQPTMAVLWQDQVESMVHNDIALGVK